MAASAQVRATVAAAFDMDRVEGLGAALKIEADGVDRRVAARDRLRDRACVADVGMHGLDPADILAEGRHPVGVPDGHPHGRAIGGEPCHDAAAEIAGSTEDRDVSLGHCILPAEPKRADGRCRPPSRRAHVRAR